MLTDPASNATCSLALSSVALAGIRLNQQSSCFCFSQSIHNSSFYFCKHSTRLSLKREHIAPGVRCKVIKHHSPLYSITRFPFVSLPLTNTVPAQCHKRTDVRSKRCHRPHSKSWTIPSILRREECNSSIATTRSKRKTCLAGIKQMPNWKKC